MRTQRHKNYKKGKTTTEKNPQNNLRDENHLQRDHKETHDYAKKSAKQPQRDIKLLQKWDSDYRQT